MSYMSKRLRLLLCLLTAIGLVLLAGCGKQAADQGAGGQSSPAGQQTRLAIGGSSMGGTAYMWTSGISKIINQYVEGVYSEVQETGGSSESLTLMASGQLQMTTANNDAAYKAYRGEGTAKIDVRTLLARYPGLLHVVVPKDSPVNSLYELKGKRVSVGEVGSSVNVGNKNILEALGLRFEDFRPEFLSVEESIEALRDGDIDAWLSGASFGVPIPSLTDLATSKGIKLIALRDEDIKKVNEKYPIYIGDVIPAGSYQGIDQDVKTLSSWGGLFVMADFPEDLAYRIVKAVHEHHQELVAVHPAGKYTTPENTVRAAITPLHPGAEKYFKEIGVLK